MREEEERLMVEKDYKDLSEAVDDQRMLIATLRQKYKEAVEEIKDLGFEYNSEKEGLLNTIRDLEKECALFKGILFKTFNHDEIDRIVFKSTYHDEDKMWVIPEF